MPTKTQIKKDIELAEKRQKARMKAPAAMGDKGEIIQKQLQQMYAPDTIGRVEGGRYIAPENEPMWADVERDYKRCVDRGWVPVLDDNDEPVLMPGGRTILLKAPRKMWEQDQAAKSRKSVDRITKGRRASDMNDVPKSMAEQAITEEIELGGIE